MLNKNKTLTSVDIRDNNLHEELGPDICEALNEMQEEFPLLVFSGLELGCRILKGTCRKEDEYFPRDE